MTPRSLPPLPGLQDPRRRRRVAFEDEHVVAVLRQQGGGREPDDAAPDHHDLRHHRPSGRPTCDVRRAAMLQITGAPTALLGQDEAAPEPDRTVRFAMPDDHGAAALADQVREALEAADLAPTPTCSTPTSRGGRARHAAGLSQPQAGPRLVRAGARRRNPGHRHGDRGPRRRPPRGPARGRPPRPPARRRRPGGRSCACASGRVVDIRGFEERTEAAARIGLTG